MKNSLIQRIHAYRKKYYARQLTAGLIQFFFLATLLFIPFGFLGLYGELSAEGKWLLSLIYYTFNIISFGYFIGKPLLEYSRGRTKMTEEQCARFIGLHFPEIKDQLLNTLDLLRLPEKNALLEAAIDQKLTFLEPFQFTSAIDFQSIKKMSRWAFLPLLSFLLIAIINPTATRIASNQLIRFGKLPSHINPVRFELLNDSLKVASGSDILVQVQVNNSLGWNTENSIIIDGVKYPLVENIENNTHHFLLKNILSDIQFHFASGQFESDRYSITTYNPPKLIQLLFEVIPPAYTQIRPFTWNKNQDLSVPYGSKINYKIQNEFSTLEYLQFFNNLGDTVRFLNGGLFNYNELSFQVILQNSASNYISGIRKIVSIPDRFPQIQVSQIFDTIQNTHYFFGNVSDDYGLSKLQVSINDEQKELPITEELSFAFSRQPSLDQGESIIFHVFDNDAILGPKKSSSQIFSINPRDSINLLVSRDKNRNQLSGLSQKAEDSMKDMQKSMEGIMDEALKKNQDKWKQEQHLKQLKEKAEELVEDLQEIRKNVAMEKDPASEKLQERLEELKENALLKEIEELQKLLEKEQGKVNPESLQEIKESIDLKKDELERTLEMLRKMKVEQDLESQIEQLEKLAQKQLDLAEQKSGKEKELQKEIQDSFTELQKKLDEIKKENEALKQPLDLPETENREQSIEQNLEKLSQEESPSNSNQEKTGQQMQDMAQSMSSDLKASQEEQAGEDIETLRQILDNLITYSKEQEKTMDGFKTSSPGKPDYIELGQKQRTLNGNSRIIVDSLRALADRVPEISTLIIEETTGLLNNTAKTIEQIVDLQINKINLHQQYAITHSNNLALLIDEALQNMRAQQNQSKNSGSGSCSKPGSSQGSKPGMSEILKKQQELNRKMAEKQGKGKKPGEGKGGSSGEKGEDGEQGKNGSNGEGKEFMQMVKEQEKIRKMLQELAQELNEKGKGEGRKLDPLIKEMEAVEWDLLNKKLSLETIKRQQEIETRLLESEKSERERDQDQQRKSGESNQKMKPVNADQIQLQKPNIFNGIQKQALPTKPFYDQIINPK